MEAPSKKVLLMGTHGSGKTSMRSIIFANYIASDTGRLGSTINVENSKVRFLSNLQLNLWDCGGQDWFMSNFLKSQRPFIFSNVEVLLYVFDVGSQNEEKDFNYYESCIKALQEYSPAAKIFILIHKIDLITDLQKRDLVFQDKMTQIKRITQHFPMTAFKTSIWDETLYKAWSSIVRSLIPNVQQLNAMLDKFCYICCADEVVLFEKATFLVLSHSNRKQEPSTILSDPHRFEKISNVIKQFKLSCLKMQSSQFQCLHFKNGIFDIQMDAFTPNTYIMVINSDRSVLPTVTGANIKIAKKQFESLLQT